MMRRDKAWFQVPASWIRCTEKGGGTHGRASPSRSSLAMRGTKGARCLALCVWLVAASGAGSASAQQQSFACTRLCWTPTKGSVTCSKRLSTQIDLTSYIYAVEHKAIAKGKPMTFFVPMSGSGQSCGSAEPQTGALSVVGYVNVRNVTGFTIGGLKVGDTIEIGANGVAEGEKNILFFPDPTQK